MRSLRCLSCDFKLRPPEFLDLKLVRVLVVRTCKVARGFKTQKGIPQVHSRRQLERGVEPTERVNSRITLENIVPARVLQHVLDTPLRSIKEVDVAVLPVT